MSTFETLKSDFESVFEGEVSTENLTLDSNLREDVGINSIGMLYMAMALEEECSIKFTNDDFLNIVTVKDVVDCIEGKLK